MPLSVSEMLRHSGGYVTEPAIFVGFGDGPQDPKNSLEIQGFVPARQGRCQACGFDLKSTLKWQATI